MECDIDLFSEHFGGTPSECWQTLMDGQDECHLHWRDICNNLYQKYSKYADSNFITGFKSDPPARFWEMELALTLINAGFNIDSKDYGPDICLLADKNIWLEAVCSGMGDKNLPDSIQDYDERLSTRKVILRLTNSINFKFKKHQKYIEEKICSEDEPFIVAINGCRLTQGGGDDLTPRILKAVFGGGQDVISITESSEIITFECIEKKFITKTNETKANIATTFFNDDQFSGISAILYSDSSYQHRPIENGSDFLMIHNPFARNPIKESFLTFGREYIPIEPDAIASRLKIKDHRIQKEFLYK